jgi:hypothetical protein
MQGRVLHLNVPTQLLPDPGQLLLQTLAPLALGDQHPLTHAQLVLALGLDVSDLRVLVDGRLCGDEAGLRGLELGQRGAHVPELLSLFGVGDEVIRYELFGGLEFRLDRVEL